MGQEGKWVNFQAAKVPTSDCLACWGYSLSCTRSPLAEFAKVLDRTIGTGAQRSFSAAPNREP
jgi:hypothetical protein